MHFHIFFPFLDLENHIYTLLIEETATSENFVEGMERVLIIAMEETQFNLTRRRLLSHIEEGDLLVHIFTFQQAVVYQKG